MYRYASTCLTGPVSRSRDWWQDGTLEPADGFGGCPETNPEADGSEMRFDLIARVRQEIAAGIYDTPERWEAALDRLLETLDPA